MAKPITLESATKSRLMVATDAPLLLRTLMMSAINSPLMSASRLARQERLKLAERTEVARSRPLRDAVSEPLPPCRHHFVEGAVRLAEVRAAVQFSTKLFDTPSRKRWIVCP